MNKLFVLKLSTISLFLVFMSCNTGSTVRDKVLVVLKDSSIVSVPVQFKISDVFLKGFKLTNNENTVAFQLDKRTGIVRFMHQPSNGTEYLVHTTEETRSISLGLKASKKDGNLVLSSKGNPLINYRYQMTYPPKGVDSVYGKSGFIHPILTPKGDTLTRIQPPDHYHHYGLWGPWTHTRIDTTRVDFWNLGQGMGTVLFKEFKEVESGSVFSSFTAFQEHLDLITSDAPQVALNEDIEVRLWDLDRPDRYMFDYTSRFKSPLENGMLFEAYRYGGGIGLRFTERWKADNSSVLTSEGNDRLTADGTNARWCIVSGPSSNGKGVSGILFMSHPKNRMHPEPIRVWPIDANNGRGDQFFQFCPIRNEAWKIAPNKEYSLNYRMVVFDGMLTAEEAEAYWQAFAVPLKVELVSN
ncbi:PmoA family protein [Maribacter chungangensis]|uniref:PmoA family protein n=1 Tax=Maribacter chungangensis TaxID=1069117 RepID=A0ABW3B6X5_9FLAO